MEDQNDKGSIEGTLAELEVQGKCRVKKNMLQHGLVRKMGMKDLSECCLRIGSLGFRSK